MSSEILNGLILLTTICTLSLLLLHVWCMCVFSHLSSLLEYKSIEVRDLSFLFSL